MFGLSMLKGFNMSSPVKTFKDNDLPQCNAADLNSYLNEINNAILGAGLSLAPADLAQLREATIIQGLASTLHDVAGTVDNIILSAKGGKTTSSAYYDGMRLLFFVENSNTTDFPTIQLGGLSQKPLKMPNGSPVEADVLKGFVEIVYQAADDRFVLALQSGGGGSQGPGSNRLFYPSDQSLKTTYQLAGDKNWMMAGPLVVEPSATLTVAPGARLAVV